MEIFLPQGNCHNGRRDNCVSRLPVISALLGRGALRSRRALGGCLPRECFWAVGHLPGRPRALLNRMVVGISAHLLWVPGDAPDENAGPKTGPDRDDLRAPTCAFDGGVEVRTNRTSMIDLGRGASGCLFGEFVDLRATSLLRESTSSNSLRTQCGLTKTYTGELNHQFLSSLKDADVFTNSLRCLGGRRLRPRPHPQRGRRGRRG